MRKGICKAPGCCRLVDLDKGERYCIEHKALERKALEERKVAWEGARHGTGAALYASPKWKAMRAEKLKQNPFCEKCGAPATDVHHIIPHNGDRDLFFDFGNLMSICFDCHQKETQREARERKARYRRQRERPELWY